MFYEYGVRMVIIGAYSVKRTYIYIYIYCNVLYRCIILWFTTTLFSKRVLFEFQNNPYGPCSALTYSGNKV